MLVLGSLVFGLLTRCGRADRGTGRKRKQKKDVMIVGWIGVSSGSLSEFEVALLRLKSTETPHFPVVLTHTLSFFINETKA